MQNTDKNTLCDLRERIDVVDEKICALLVERFELCKQVGETKKRGGKDVENKDREREVIERVRAYMPDELKAYAEDVFRLLIEESKDLQRKL